MAEEITMNVYEYMWKVLVVKIAEEIEKEDKEHKLSSFLKSMADLEVAMGLVKIEEPQED